ncbi:MAG: hypothetical protein HY023_01030 [Chloroflexi bacterium]|nr:hypothetical protein [Chloroflexota bacterium]MBI3760274.1 hypothetical protein [Chloroflexota bacterium]
MSGQSTVFHLAGRTIAEMDQELLAFLKAKVNTFIKWDLVRFFHENPHTSDTAENIARYAGREATAIAAELADLAESGILVSHPLGNLPIYSLTGDARTLDLIARFVAACDDRQFRVAAIHYIIRSNKR